MPKKDQKARRIKTTTSDEKMIVDLLKHMTPQEKAEIDQLLISSQPVDRNVYPFKAGSLFWKSEEDYKASSRLFPSLIDAEDNERHMAMFKEWISFVQAHSVPDPGRPLIPEVLLPMLNSGKSENKRTFDHDILISMETK